MSQRETGLIHAYILDGEGGGQKIDWELARTWKPGEGILWLHLDYEHPETQQWLKEKSGLDVITQKSLIAEETRPRCAGMDNGLLINLRGVNTNPGSDPEDMVSIRLYCDGERIISTRRRRLLSISDITTTLDRGDGPKTGGEFISTLAYRLIDRMSEVISNLDDAVDSMEEEIISGSGKSYRGKLVELRREAIMLRRYLAPQRDALTRLQAETVSFLSAHDRIRVGEAGDRLIRYIEDLDSCKDRAAVAYEELTSHLAEQMNSRMYVLAVVAALFLPLGFLTGLFGINVGGIPLADDPNGFIEIALILVVVVIIQIIIFRLKRWF